MSKMGNILQSVVDFTTNAPGQIKRAFTEKSGQSLTRANQKLIQEEQAYLGSAAESFKKNLPAGTNFDEFQTALKGGSDSFETFVESQAEGSRGVLRNIGSELLGSAEKPAPRYTPETLGRMSDNLSRTGEVGLGITQRDTVGSSSILRTLGSSEGLLGAGAAIGIGAGLGAGAAALTGNDKGSGAIAGGISVIGMRGLSRAVSDNIGGIENFMMKKVLGDDMLTREGIEEMVEKGGGSSAQIDLLKDQMTRMGRSQTYQDNRLIALSKNEKLQNNLPFNEQNLRTGNLQRASAKETGNMSAVQRGMHGMLTKNKGIGMQTRYLVGSGAMLSGVAFSSPRKDRSRGFNRNRGNRF